MSAFQAPSTFVPDSGLVERVHPARNVEERRAGARPRLVILHYTGMSSAEKAIDWLSREESRVSCHYVIDEAGRITQMVPEALRAWHAGVSCWQGERDINSCSIGIEIHNLGHSHGYPDFPPHQIEAVASLTHDICRRHHIAPEGVLGHSDVAISRKIDPGEKFPWQTLAKHGVGRWVPPAPRHADKTGAALDTDRAHVEEARRLLHSYGYDVCEHGEFDEALGKAVQAFQRHFRPQCIDGKLDRSTLQTLRQLVSTSKKIKVASSSLTRPGKTT